MKIEIEVEDKYISAVAAQLIVTADTEEDAMLAEEARKKCTSETIVINPEKLGEDSRELQLAMAMIAMGQVCEELK